MNTPGWRSARVRLQSTGRTTATRAPQPSQAPLPAGNRFGYATLEQPPSFWPWQNARLDLSLVAFLVYVWVIVTYMFPIADIAIITAIITLPLSGRKLVLPTPLVFFLVFVLWAGLGYFTSNYQPFALLGLEKIAKIWLIAFVAANVVRDQKHLRLFIIFFLGAFALYPVRGAYANYFVYHATEYGRAAWNYIYENPNDLAAFALFPLGLCAGVVFTEQNKYLRLAGKVGLAMIPLMMFITQSRGGLLALFVFAIFGLAGHRQRLRMLLGAAGIVIVVVLFAPSDVWTRLGNIAGADTETLSEVGDQGSAEQRYEIWKVARTIAADTPVTGVGIGTYPLAHARMARRVAFDPTARGARDTHSTFLNVLAETGVVGLLLFLSIFISAGVRAETVRRQLRNVRPDLERMLYFTEVSMLAFFVACIFGTYVLIPFAYLHAATLWVMSDVGQRQLTPATGRRSRG